MSGGEREDLHKYQMSPVDCECRKTSDGERDCCQLQWSGNFFLKLRLGLNMALKDSWLIKKT